MRVAPPEIGPGPNDLEGLSREYRRLRAWKRDAMAKVDKAREAMDSIADEMHRLRRVA